MLRRLRGGLNMVLGLGFYSPGFTPIREWPAVVRRLAPTRFQDYLSAEQTLTRTRMRISELTEGSGRYRLTDLGRSLLKDSLKTGLKASLNAKEEAAWTDFFLKDLSARNLYALRQVAAEVYWRAHDAREAYRLSAGELDAGPVTLQIR